jgi:hypothetical protein
MPLAQCVVRRMEIVSGDAIESNQQIVIGPRVRLIASSGRSIKHDRREVVTMRDTQFVNQLFEFC